MNIKQIIAIIIAAAGVALVANAKFSMDRTGENVRKKLTGQYTSNTRMQLYGGVGLAIVGVVAVVYFRRKK